MKWSDEFRKLKVRTNAETEADSKTAIEFGAEGIDCVGLSICSLMKREFYQSDK